jgi:hypothetical protein
LTHKSLNAAQIEDDANFDGGALGDDAAWQNASAEYAGPSGEDLPSIDRNALAHADPLP